MNETTSNFIPSITAIVAILAPVLVSIINNHHQYRLRKLELEQRPYEQTVLHQRDIFEKFLSAFNKACHLQTEEAVSEYSSCYSLVYIYLPKPIRDELGEINLLIKKHLWAEVIKHVDVISMAVANELDNLPIKQPRQLHIFCRPNRRPGI